MQNSNSTLEETQDLLFDLFGIKSPESQFTQQEIKFASPAHWVMISVEPKPAPRPRASSIFKGIVNGKPVYTAHVYNPSEYMDWKKDLAETISRTEILPMDYNQVDMILGIPLKKSFAKKVKRELVWRLHDRKPDFDNYLKGVLDAIQQSGKVINDSKFGSGLIEKIWIPEEHFGFILFRLKKVNHPVFDAREILTKIMKS